MNHEQWTKLLEATKGHKERPLEDCDPEGLACIAFCAGWTDADVALAAAAPDLLAEVERLRAWMVWMLEDDKNAYRAGLIKPELRDALNGAEVVK